MSFVDTRFQITVRPQTEYLIPDVAHAVTAVFLGDGTVEEANESLAALHESVRCEENSSEVLDDETLSEMRRLGATVCTNVHEYLQPLSRHWYNYARQIKESVEKETRILQAQLEDARRVRTRYKDSSQAAAVDREYRGEVRRISNAFEEGLVRLRTQVPQPVCTRPLDLEQSGSSLKEAFLNAVGTMPTATLLQTKTAFARDLVVAQRELTLDYHKRMCRLLHK